MVLSVKYDIENIEKEQCLTMKRMKILKEKNIPEYKQKMLEHCEEILSAAENRIKEIDI